MMKNEVMRKRNDIVLPYLGESVPLVLSGQMHMAGEMEPGMGVQLHQESHACLCKVALVPGEDTPVS